MSQDKFFIQLVKSLEDTELEKVAVVYLAEVDLQTNIINCNGPWDSGIDLRNPTPSKMEIQYQITTEEKNFEVKLFKDLNKAKQNVDKYGAPGRVKYFYSYPLSNTSILGFKKKAKEDYNLQLDIIEANAIAGTASSYPEIRNLLVDIVEIEKYTSKSDFFDEPKVKAFYDLMSLGSSTDIKYNIIKSFLLNFLFSYGQLHQVYY